MRILRSRHGLVRNKQIFKQEGQKNDHVVLPTADQTVEPTPLITKQPDKMPPEYENAIKSARRMLKSNPMSHDMLVNKLIERGDKDEVAQYGAENCGADWNEQAAKRANNLLKNEICSVDDLIEQLEYEGFSHDEALFGSENH